MKRSLQSLIDAWEHDPILREPPRLRERIDAIDRLQEDLIEIDDHADAALKQRTQAICTELENINQRIYQAIRRDIKQHNDASALMAWLPSPLFHDTADCHVNGEGYDYLDELLDGVLQFQPPAQDIATLAPEMVFYQPTPARHIFDLIQRLPLNEHDVLIDLGAGMGHVPLLAAIGSRTRCIGIECEPAYVACAQQCASTLGLANAHFLAQDVRSADLSEGTVFYLYTPFTGTLWRSVVDRLKLEAGKRPIRIGTLGPCTSLMAEEPWLKTSDSLHTDRIVVFHSI
jgi:hypothetical protein